jgi:hypothetical protein
VEGRGPFLERFFGKTGPKGISPLYQVDVGSFQSPLFRELRKLLEAVVAPVQEALGRCAAVNTYALNDLERELSLYLNALDLSEHLRAVGLPVCRPEIAPMADRLALLEEAYSVGLALQMTGQPRRPPRPAATARAPKEDGSGVVTNAMTFGGEHARVWVLTGPNRGGKTTYTRAVGQAHVLFQAGLSVPARRATMSPVDAIYTHFPSPESDQLGVGKLDEEAARLAQIFHIATPHGLILLNEVLAGTSAIEALGLALDAVRALRLLGVRAVYTTHLHELPARAAEINVTTPGDSLVGSLVAGVEEAEGGQTVIRAGHRRTFRIQPGPPRHVSYASEIAEQHGISFAQLRALFRRRGLLSERERPPEA